MAEALRVGFAGTPPFAATALAAILDAGFEVSLGPDAGRMPPGGAGMKLAPERRQVAGPGARHPRVAASATQGRRRSQRTRRVRRSTCWSSRPMDRSCPLPLLEWPRHGCLNIHASLLPRWRGAAPIARALLAGDRQTGISIMQMDAGLDTGPVVAHTRRTHRCARNRTDTARQALRPRARPRSSRHSSALARDRRLEAVPQSADGATYANKIERSEATIDWSEPAVGDRSQDPCVQPVSGGTDDARRRADQDLGGGTCRRALRLRRHRRAGRCARALSSPAATAHWSCANCSARAAGACRRRHFSPAIRSRRDARLGT